MNITTENAGTAKNGGIGKRIVIVLLVFLLGMLVGFLLSPRCRQCFGGDARVRGDQIGGTGSGPPSRIAIGRGAGDDGTGGSQANGDTEGKGHSGDAQGAGGNISAGGGQGSGQSAGGELQSGKDAQDTLRTAVLKRAQGLNPDGPDTPEVENKTPTGKVLSAPDFTYDRTALPRYPNAQQVESALAYANAANPQVWNSTVGITTADTFDTVVAWYRAQLPPGWQTQVVGDMQQIAQQLSIQNITAMLSAATDSSNDSGSAASAINPPSATESGRRVQVAIFQPPGGAAGKPAVMVARRGDEPVTIMLGARNP